MSGRIVRPESTSMLELPEIGRLHIGMKNDKGYPMSIDYFRPTGKYEGLFRQALGEKPQTIQVIFPSDDAEKVCNERYEYRDDKGALVAGGDGQTFKVWNGKVYAPYTIEDYPNIMQLIAEKNPTKRKDDNWDIVLSIKFIVPAVRGVVGVWGLTTKGRASSVRNIRESFDAVQMMRQTVTTSVFDMSVHFHKSNKPGESSRYPVLELVCNDNSISTVREMLNPEKNTKSLLLPEK